jgi:ATP-binding cassette, subfamily B, multidrug efflux pump
MKEAMFFSRKNLDLYDKHIKFIKYIIIINIAVGVALNIVILFIVIFGSLLVINRDATGMTAGQLTEYLSYFFALIWPTMALSQFIQINSQAQGSAQRIAKFLDHEIDVRDHEMLNM